MSHTFPCHPRKALFGLAKIQTHSQLTLKLLETSANVLSILKLSIKLSIKKVLSLLKVKNCFFFLLLPLTDFALLGVL